MTNREALAAMSDWAFALWLCGRIQTAFYWGETPDADAELKWLQEEAAGCFGCNLNRDLKPEWCHSDNVCLVRKWRQTEA